MGNAVRAIEDYDKIIQLKPGYMLAYNNRGLAFLHLQEWEKAKSDLTTAQNMGVDIIDFFRILYSNVANFEQEYGVKLPKDITVLLTPPQT